MHVFKVQLSKIMLNSWNYNQNELIIILITIGLKKEKIKFFARGD